MRHIISQIGKEGNQIMVPAGSGRVWRGAGCVCFGYRGRERGPLFSEQQRFLLLHTDSKHQAFLVACSERVQSANAFRIRSSYLLFATKPCA